MTPSVAEENSRPGTGDWRLRRTAVVAGRSKRIEGWAYPYSAPPGGTIEVRASADPGASFVATVYRLGYYGGTGARELARLGPFPAGPQPVPPRGADGLRACAWPVSFTLPIPADWRSGVHLVKLTREDDGVESYVLFVVTPGARTPEVVVQTSEFCWQAYNRWPDGASCLYDTSWWVAKLWPLMETADTRTRVSQERPYGIRKWDSSPDLLANVIGSGEYLQWEFPIAYWLESRGYDVGYTTNLDTHRDGIPAGAKAWISAGHDEYWTDAIHRHAATARERGTSLLFLSGNAAFTELELTASPATGAPETVLRRRAMFTKREAAIMGVANGYAVVGDDDWRCEDPGHWLFDHTGMKRGDGIRNLVGWETHTILGTGLRAHRVVGTGRIPLWIRGLPLGNYPWYSTIHEGPRGNAVFAASTIYWGLGLARPPVPLAGHAYLSRVDPDPRVATMTGNLLARAGAEAER